MKWISVNNKLPAYNYPVLFCYWNDWSDVPFRRVGFLSDNNTWYTVERGMVDGIVSHWCEIPSKDGLENPYGKK